SRASRCSSTPWRTRRTKSIRICAGGMAARSMQTISTSRRSREGWPPSPSDGRSEKPPTPEAKSQPDKATFTHRLRIRCTSGDCYVFGTPRTVWGHGQNFIEQPFAMRRSEDIVPRVPPAMLGYESFRRQLQSDGASFLDRGLLDWWPFLKWINALAFGR